MPGARRTHDGDLGVQQLPALQWKDALADLGELYGWVEQFASETIGWYLGEKERKASWSRGLRALAAALATLGGAIPVAALAASKPVYGNWGFVLLAFAAGSLAYDRFFGYSSAWLVLSQHFSLVLWWPAWGCERPAAERPPALRTTMAQYGL
jgi:hypothetical protein